MAIFRGVVDLRVRFFQRAPKAGGVVSTLAVAHVLYRSGTGACCAARGACVLQHNVLACARALAVPCMQHV